MTWFIIIALCIVFSFYKRAIKAGDSTSVSSETKNVRSHHDVQERQQTNSSPYFSYENDSSASTDRVFSPRIDDYASEDNAPDFDLRQAIIYDTILNNPYSADR